MLAQRGSPCLPPGAVHWRWHGQGCQELDATLGPTACLPWAPICSHPTRPGDSAKEHCQEKLNAGQSLDPCPTEHDGWGGGGEQKASEGVKGQQ